jgi:glycosyltransferase involved in cell wall biosynthesis
LKILHTEASCGWGGQEIRILEESRGLIQRGHEVSVACPAHARMATEAARFGVPVTRCRSSSRPSPACARCARHLAAARPDVVNTHSSADSWLVALACATLTSPPAIVRTRHISAPVAGNFANRWLYRQARAVATTGESLRRHLLDTLDLDPERVTSVPTGIDTLRFAPGRQGCRQGGARTRPGGQGSSASSPPCAVGRATCSCSMPSPQ